MSASDPTTAATPAEHATEEPLDRRAIDALTGVEVARAQALFAQWEHPYRGLRMSRARRVLGQAHSDGSLRVSTVFLGTDAVDDLRDTIRHEIAHLIAGIRCGHGPRWQRVAAALGATPRAGAHATSAALRARMDDAPWLLIAELADGREATLRAAYRRSRQYLGYRAGNGARQYLYRGELVQAFRYERRDPDDSGAEARDGTLDG